MAGYEKILKSCIDYKRQVTIERDRVDDEELTAIPIMMSRQLLLVHYLYDFYLDGYKVLRISDITRVERGEVEEFHDKIIDREGMLEVSCPPKVSIVSWKDFFCTMIEENKMIDISLEKLQSGKTFFVGKVKAAKENFLEFQEIDVLGNYERKTVKILYRDITLVSYENRYSVLLDKYSH